MDFEKGLKLLEVTKTRLIEEKLYKKWLVELPYFEKPVDFETYKNELIEEAKIRLRTPEQRKFDIEKARIKAKKAIQKLDYDGTFSNPQKFYRTKVINQFKRLLEIKKLILVLKTKSN